MLTIEYDGTGYHGWQSQKNALAIQDVIEGALKKLTGENIRLIASGRTDAGVHALGQVANFHTSSAIPPEKFSYALNSLLPDDIVIKKSVEVTESFHSRYDARGKKYRYIILNSEFPSALMRNREWHIRERLNRMAMKKSLQYLLGKHDFSAFMTSGSSAENTVRTVTAAELYEEEQRILFEITADGFLYNMVRIIVGTLVKIGTGEIAPDKMQYIIESGDRERAGNTAPASGLYLVEVYYDNIS
jgi:tRNA pseudouridine38-40 synthase